MDSVKKMIRGIRKRHFRILLLLLIVIALIIPGRTILSGPVEKVQRDTIKMLEEEYKKLLLMVDKSVKLSLEEYNKLLAEIEKAEEQRRLEEERLKKIQEMSSAEKYNFTGGRMLCNITDTAVSVDLEMNIKMLKEGWKEIQIERLPSLEEIMIDSKSAIIGRQAGNDRYRILTEKGDFSKFRFIYHPPVQELSRGNQIYKSTTIELNQRSKVDVEIILPKGSKPSPMMAQRISFTKRDDQYHAKTTTDFTMPLTIEWYVPKKETEEKEGEYSAYIYSYFTVYEKSIRYISLIQLELRGKITKPIPIELPPGYKAVDWELMQGMEIKFDQAGMQGELKLNEEPEEALQFILYLETDLGEKQIKVLPVKFKGALRQFGYIAVKTEGFKATVKDKGSYDQIDTRLLPVELTTLEGYESDYGFMYSIVGKELNPAVFELEKVVATDLIAAYIRIAYFNASVSEEGIFMAEIDMDVINNNQQFLIFDLPKGSEMLSAFVDGKGVKPVTSEEKGMMIPIRPKLHSKDGLVKVKFVYRKQIGAFDDEGKAQIEFPEMNLPVNLIRLSLYLPKNYEYDEFEGSYKKGYPSLLITTFKSRRELQEDAKTASAKTGEKMDEYRLNGITQGYIDSLNVRDETGKAEYADGFSEAALPVQISVPLNGLRFDFYDLLVIGRRPHISFEYEKE